MTKAIETGSSNRNNFDFDMTMIQGDKLPTLASSRLQLRWLDDRDVGNLSAIFSDPKVMRYWSSTAWADEAAGIELIKSVRSHFAAGSLYQWGVALRKDDTIIGTCTLANVDAQNRRAEIGFALRHDHWGRGYMFEATSTLLRFVFEQLALHRMEADVDPRNEPSIRLLERLGFQREGISANAGSSARRSTTPSSMGCCGGNGRPTGRTRSRPGTTNRVFA